MILDEHKEHHKRLHKAFDELLADFLRHTRKFPSKTSTLELAKWANEQTIEPTEEKV